MPSQISVLFGDQTHRERERERESERARETEALACLSFTLTINNQAADGLIFRICGMLSNAFNLLVDLAFIS